MWIHLNTQYDTPMFINLAHVVTVDVGETRAILTLPGGEEVNVTDPAECTRLQAALARVAIRIETGEKTGVFRCQSCGRLLPFGPYIVLVCDACRQTRDRLESPDVELP